MIFVTVGTHEQSFNRLIKEVDELVGEKVITEPVFIQTGYSDYVPKHAEYARFLNYDQMEKTIDSARIVITHGGPASFINVLAKGKKPIIVPRLSKFHEHVNDHQITFAKELKDRNYEIIIVEDIDDLRNEIVSFSSSNQKFHSHNTVFVSNFIKIVDEIL